MTVETKLLLIMCLIQAHLVASHHTVSVPSTRANQAANLWRIFTQFTVFIYSVGVMCCCNKAWTLKYVVIKCVWNWRSCSGGWSLCQLQWGGGGVFENCGGNIVQPVSQSFIGAFYLLNVTQWLPESRGVCTQKWIYFLHYKTILLLNLSNPSLHLKAIIIK